jgi:hypothetical protein
VEFDAGLWVHRNQTLVSKRFAGLGQMLIHLNSILNKEAKQQLATNPGAQNLQTGNDGKRR